MSLGDFFISLIRTVVPAMAGWIAAWLLRTFGVELPSGQLDGVLWVVFSSAYYALVRALESRWPWVGVLLGWRAQPHYDQERRGLRAV